MDLGLRFSLPGTAASITLLCSISISLPSSPSTSQQILLFQGFLSAADPALSDWGQIHTGLCFMDQTGANQWCSKGNSPTEVEATCWQNRARFEFHVLESVKLLKTECNSIPPSDDLWSVQYSENKNKWLFLHLLFCLTTKVQVSLSFSKPGEQSQRRGELKALFMRSLNLL